MRDRYTDLVSRVRDSVLAGPGATPTELRQAVHDRAAAPGRGEVVGAEAPADVPSHVPAELKGLVGKVTDRAYEVTDDDVDSLCRAGYSEDAIFEIAVSGALGAGLARLQRGLSALSEADDAS